MAKNVRWVIQSYSRQREEAQARLVAAENKLPYINLLNYSLTGDVMGLLPDELVQKYQVVAFKHFGTTVQVATPYVHQRELAAAMNKLGADQELVFEPHVCSVSSIKYALDKFNKLVSRPKETAARAERESPKEFIKKLHSLQDLAGVIQATTTSELLETILTGALAFEATDIHFEPQADNTQIRFRVDGELRPIAAIELSSYKLLASRIKNLARIRLNKLTKPLDGRFTTTVEAESLDVRVNILPAAYGETIELRLLTGKGLLELTKLGLDEATTAAINRHIQAKSGLILVTGPTGSGKTTTLYAILQLLNKPDKKIVTIEDPVEYKLPGIEQIQVDPPAGFDFAEALRGTLRQDPDIILIGEIRDKETAEIAIHASLTGHLVLTTLHSNSAAASFARLIEIGVSPYLLSDAIKLIISQHLEKTPCPDCQGQGCQKCQFSGFKGRQAVAKFIEPDERYQELIKRQATISEFEKLSHS